MSLFLEISDFLYTFANGGVTEWLIVTDSKSVVRL